MSIFDVEHQPRAHRIIQRALASRRMPHAYLFAGPEGVGKEMLAHRLAKTLLCASPVRRPMPDEIAYALADGQGMDACDECQDCRLVEADTHPDLFLIYRQLNKQHPDSTIRKQKALVLGVEVIRHFLIDRSGTRPNRGRAKVFIIREAERLNESAQNSLLKTLEEPPDATFLILLTNAMDRMLPTTRSRCQRVLFQPLPTDYVLDQLAALRPNADAQETTYVARHVGGSLGAALRLIDDGLFGLKRTWGERLAKLASAGKESAPDGLAKPFVDDAKQLGKCVADRDPEVSDTDATRVGLQTLLAALADFYADALRRRSGADVAPTNADQMAIVEQLAASTDESGLQQSLRHLSEADANLGRNAHLELTLETLFIRLATAGRRGAAILADQAMGRG